MSAGTVWPLPFESPEDVRTRVDGSVRVRSNGFAGAPAAVVVAGTGEAPADAFRAAAAGTAASEGAGAVTLTFCSPRIASSISSAPQPFSIASLANASERPPPLIAVGTGGGTGGGTLVALAWRPGTGANVKGAAVGGAADGCVCFMPGAHGCRGGRRFSFVGAGPEKKPALPL